jgi:outer membrane lipoprotein
MNQPLRCITTLACTLVLVTTLTLSGCATIPPELAVGGPFLNITPTQALHGEHEGGQVRWGGAVIQTRPKGIRTCFEIMGLTLDRQGEPRSSDTSTGRFLACANGFFEPAIYSQGRYVTFTGRIDGVAPQQIGEAEYLFPKLETEQVYLWPKKSEVIYVPYPVPSWGPYYDPYWPYHKTK